MLIAAMGKPRVSRSKRALLERLWAEGLDPEEIKRRMGWKTKARGSTIIAVYRSRGYNLPHRLDAEVVAAAASARWPGR